MQSGVPGRPLAGGNDGVDDEPEVRKTFVPPTDDDFQVVHRCQAGRRSHVK